MPRAHPPQVGLLDGDHVPPRDHREQSEQGHHATWQRHRPLGQAPTLHRIPTAGRPPPCAFTTTPRSNVPWSRPWPWLRSRLRAPTRAMAWRIRSNSWGPVPAGFHLPRLPPRLLRHSQPPWAHLTLHFPRPHELRLLVPLHGDLRLFTPPALVLLLECLCRRRRARCSREPRQGRRHNGLHIHLLPGHLYIHIYTYIYIHIYVYIHIHMYIYIYTHTHTHIYIYIYTYIYIYIHQYMYIYIHIVGPVGPLISMICCTCFLVACCTLCPEQENAGQAGQAGCRVQ